MLREACVTTRAILMRCVVLSFGICGIRDAEGSNLLSAFTTMTRRIGVKTGSVTYCVI